MKLILLTALVIKYTAAANEQYSFSPQFHKPNQGGYGSKSSIFLPPEAHTPIPYYPIKNMNNLPFPYLPPTGTKAPSVYPSPFPVILSSTLVPIFDDDDDEQEVNKKNNHHFQVSSPAPHNHHQKQNTSENAPRGQMPVRREMRATPKMGNYHNPIDRNDMRFSQHFSTPSPNNQNPRNMIIDTHRNDNIFDQIKSASAQNPHYVAAHGFTISSTTEPAIPILRLSNEMDLDGSFSYEALGADQTHYVQHSHMENLGSDKQEQVVEGSYSYVGDNGQTYTVNYIADSNGFRASGDHLPVAPPIPEIIQRAVQYNLAEEARKPPHLRGWQDDEKDFDSSDKGQKFAAPPPRNLFTGRTPEAFSYSFAQGINNENNLAAASSQVPVKANAEYIIDQTRAKPNNGPISPQITFVASQGAHVPSQNQQISQQSISRIFNNEKPMPQLVNYEANNKDADHDANKGLWRWQYGLNSNNLSQIPEKNTISRSFGEGDDIMINFGDMTSEQYARMIQSQLEQSNNDSGTASHFANHHDSHQVNDNHKTMSMAENVNNNEYQQQPNQNNYYYSPMVSTGHSETTEPPQIISTVSHGSSSPMQYYNKDKDSAMNDSNLSTTNTYSSYSSPSHPESNQYDYQENPYEFRRIKSLHVDSTTKSNMHNINSIPVSYNANKPVYNSWPTKNNPDDELYTITQVPAFYNTVSAPKFLNEYEEKTDFRPIHKNFDEYRETTTITPQTTTENIFNTNIFLKSIGKPKKTESHNVNQKISEEPLKMTQKKVFDESKHIMQIPNKLTTETKADKVHKFFPHQSKPLHEEKNTKQKPLELTDVINYITNKHLFESSKIKPKSNNLNYENFDQKHEKRFDMFHSEKNEENKAESLQRTSSPKFNREEREELRGMIKNYKVLQRNNNAKNLDQNGFHLRKEMSPSSVRTMQSSGLPPLGRAGPSMKSYLPPIYV